MCDTILFSLLLFYFIFFSPSLVFWKTRAHFLGLGEEGDWGLGIEIGI